MTRTLSTRSSRKKAFNLTEGADKENVPVRALPNKKFTGKKKCLASTKEDVPYNERPASRNSCESPQSPVRKLVRKTSNKDSNKEAKTRNDKNVLSDQTNTSFLSDNLQSPLGQSFGIPVIKSVNNNNRLASVKSCKSPPSPVRKSVRKPSHKDSNKDVNTRNDKNVLSDKTNTSALSDNLQSPLDQSFVMPVMKYVNNNNRLASVKSCKSPPSPVRKSVRKSSVKDLNKEVKTVNNKNMLSDKTSTSTLSDNLQSSLDQSFGIPVTKTVHNNNRLASLKSCKSPPSPIRKSVRKSSAKDSNKQVRNISDRNVLNDKTNKSTLTDNLLNHLNHSFGIPVIRTMSNKNTIIRKRTSPPKPKVDFKNKNHVPVYKTVEKIEEEKDNKLPQEVKKETVYDFEVDENEEPVPKKKRKKRVYTKKPKLGPSALTINNIKYSSSESLVSLPDKPIARKKKTAKIPKTHLKPINSMTNLASIEDSSCSISSFISHPPSMRLCGNGSTNIRRELSVLQESQSELNTSNAVSGHIDILPQSMNASSVSSINNVPLPSSSTKSELSALQKSQSGLNTSIAVSGHIGLLPQSMNASSVSRISNVPLPSSKEGISSSPWCLSSLKTYQAKSPCAQNLSNSSHDFLSSTPCKRTSAVICNNSVFDDTYDLPNSIRQSSGFIRKNDLTANDSLDNCFGFDEPEELEEPLISPIKNNIDVVKRLPPKPLVLDEPDKLKPSPQEVIELLKASIPKDIQKQRVTDMFDEEFEEKIDNSLPLNTDEEIVGSSFTKPPRRSYERQRRVRHKSETEEESEKEECSEEKNEVVKENVPKKINWCYKKINTTRSIKHPRVTKAKQRLAKEEEEMERLAAKMNAQFHEIEKVNLVVE